MTDNDCKDCELPVAVHEETARALAEGGLDETAKARLVADALERAADAATDGPGSTPRHWLLAAAALLAIAVVVGVWSLRGDAEPAPALQSIEDERRANQRLLDKPATQAWLAKLDKDAFVALVDGVTFDADKDLGKLLARIDKKHPHARHRRCPLE